MDGKPLVTRIAGLILGLSLLNIIMCLMFMGGRGIVSDIVGLAINLILAIFLISGQNWARWWMAIRCGFGTILSFSAWSQLGNLDISVFSIVRLWLFIAALFSAVIGAYLLLSKRVNEHFNPSSGF
jgi:hypothetical protein